MKIETDDNSIWLAGIVCIAVVIISAIAGACIYNTYPFSQGYVQQQQEGSQATLLTKPSK